jgi:hypothetical protein
MSNDHSPDTVDAGTAQKDPADWTTGDEPMTGPQRSYLETLLQQAGEQTPEDLDRLSKSEASRRIDALQERAGRGQ